jgi:hypothetical protein
LTSPPRAAPIADVGPLAAAAAGHGSERALAGAQLDALSELGAEHALFGGRLTGYYGKDRPTTDVDLLVREESIEPPEARWPAADSRRPGSSFC